MPTFEYEIPTDKIPQTHSKSRSTLIAKKSKEQFHPTKEAAIRKKLRQISISQPDPVLNWIPMFEAIRHGDIPTNEQLHSFILKIRDSQAMMIESSRLTDMGKKFWIKMQDLMTTISSALTEKNTNEEIQQFMFHSRLAAPFAGTKISSYSTALENTRKTALLMVMNAPFRELIKDLNNLFQKMFMISGLSTTVKETIEQDHVEEFNKNLSIDARHHLIKEFFSILDRFKQDSEFLESFSFMISALRMLEKNSEQMATQRQIHPGRERMNLKGDANLIQAQKDLQHIIQNFAGNHSLEPILEILYEFQQKAIEDFQLRDLLDESITFCERCLADDQYPQMIDSLEKGAVIIQRFRDYLFLNWKTQLQKLFKEIDSLLDALHKDPLTTKLMNQFKDVSLDVFTEGDTGKNQLNQALIRDAVVVGFPILLDQIKIIPISKIEHSDETMDYIIDPFSLVLDDILPSFMELKFKKTWQLGIRDEIQDSFMSSMTLSIQEFHFDVSNIKFKFSRKTGFPRIQDKGMMNLKTFGDGISIQVKIDYLPNDPEITLKTRSVLVFVDKMKMKLNGTKHDNFYNSLKPMVSSIIKAQLAEILELKIRGWVNSLDKLISKKKIHKAATKSDSEIEGLLYSSGLLDKETVKKSNSHEKREFKERQSVESDTFDAYRSYSASM